MSALILAVKRQADRTLRSSRRLNVIMLLLFAIAALGMVLLFNTPAFSVQYDGTRVPVIPPIETQVCPGDTIHYPLTTSVTEDEIPGQLDIAESWCEEGLSGPCTGVNPPRPELPLLEPKLIYTDGAARVVPETLTPGVYHFWHSATDALGRVSGYIVAPVNVKDCAQ